MATAQIPQGGYFPAALLRGVGAAGGEGTAGTRCDQLRGRSLDGVEPSAAHPYTRGLQKASPRLDEMGG